MPVKKAEFFMKIHESEKSRVLALCDKGLLGKEYSEGALHLDLKNYAYFYKGRLVGEEEARAEMKIATSMNLAGKKSVALAGSLGLVGRDCVRTIGGVPHVQVYKI